jgi:GT2 family glycosyltransferase
MTRLPVIAAVPAHNNAKTLRTLLDELVKQGYDDIYVLDDASKDNTVRIAKSYSKKIKVIEGDKNVGAGANRNRIIGLTPPAIIHFIDADMQLLSKDTPDKIRAINWPKNAAFIGGLVRNPDGTQNPFNFGPRPNFFTGIFKGGLQYIIWLSGRLNKPAGIFLRHLFAPALAGFPNFYRKPRPHLTYWVAESNMLVKSDVFARHGGFDPRFRYSEIEDLALRLHRRGRRGYFTPEIDAIHGSMDNIFNSRGKRWEARKKFYAKHGWLIYIIPPLADYLANRRSKVLEPSARRKRDSSG